MHIFQKNVIAFTHTLFDERTRFKHFFKHRFHPFRHNAEDVVCCKHHQHIPRQACIAFLPCKRKRVFYARTNTKFRFTLISGLKCNFIRRLKSDVFKIINQTVRIFLHHADAVFAVELVYFHCHCNGKPKLLHTHDYVLHRCLFNVGFMDHFRFFRPDTADFCELHRFGLNNFESFRAELIHKHPCSRLADTLNKAARKISANSFGRSRYIIFI